MTSDQDETIHVYDSVDSPMIIHSFEKREIMGFVPKKKKAIPLFKIQDDESGQAIIRNIRSEWIKTEYNRYLNDCVKIGFNQKTSN